MSWLPYPNLFPNETDYWAKDKYEDFHPIFNLSQIASVHLQMSEANLEYILNPLNSYTQDYVSANFTFKNSEITETMNDIGVRYANQLNVIYLCRIRGAFSRLRPKKSLKISFNKFQKGNTFYKLKKLNLVNPADLTFMKNKMISEMYRAMNLPIYRMRY